MFITLPSGPTLHVHERQGDRPTLVFLHYYGGSSRTWSAVIEALPADMGFIAPDLRGWGRSEHTVDGHTLAGYAEDIEAVLAASHLDDYVLVGHSMGGKIAQLIASRRPAGLRGVVLVAPAPPTAMALPPEARAGLAAVYDTRESIEGALDHVLTARALSPEQREQVIEDSMCGVREARLAWPMTISQEDITDAARRIDVPVLVLSGDEDKVDATATLRAELMPHLAQGELRVLSGVGHLIPLEAAEEAARSIAAFVATLPALR